jgi:hypothetical protein
MTQLFEADVALLHFAGGAARITQPPGTFAQTAPRRAARGRREDFFFINLSMTSKQGSTPGHVDHLARLAADVYYGTPGSVTSALRESLSVVNDHVLDANRDDETQKTYVSVITGVLRGHDLYVAQCGPGQTVLVRPGVVTRFTSEEAAQKPLGTSISPYVRYHHVLVDPDDIFIFTTASSEIWSDVTLSGLSTLTLEQAVDRLVAASDQDLTGVVARILPFGQSTARLERPLPVESGGPLPQGVQRPSRDRSRSSRPSRRREAAGFEVSLLRASAAARDQWIRLMQVLSSTFNRLAPGLSEPLHPDMFSRRLLAGTALVIPVIVVFIAALIYFGRGRREQFKTYLELASAAAATAQAQPLGEETRIDWETAMSFLTQAENYGSSDEFEGLRAQVESALDTLDLIARLEFRPLIDGGLGTEANLTAITATATDLYVLDETSNTIFHAWGIPERGYDIDSTFDCLSPDRNFSEISSPIDLVIQVEPGALGAEGVVAIDGDGTLLYCAPERQPAMAQLTPPDIGWGRIHAIDVFEEILYVLDPGTNSVWMYESVGGLFSGNPKRYFAEEVRDLSSAIDLALAQDELVILYADGRLDRCRRTQEPDPEGGERIRVECDPEPYFQDDRPGRERTAQIPGAVPVEMDYSPPPEPSLYFLDQLSNSIFQYSMRLVYQGQYLPVEPFDSEITAMTLGPPNDLYLAVASQIYHAQPMR